MSKHKYKPLCDFSDEILTEIFKRLPVKYVLRCGCVRKSWYHLVRTPFFISLHSTYQKLIAPDNPKYLLFRNVDAYGHEFTIRSDDAQCQEYWTFKYRPYLPDAWYAQSNGLFCISSTFDINRFYDHPDICLWNPLVGKCKIIPDSFLHKSRFEMTWKALAFGFLPDVNDYVVVYIVKPSSTSAPDPSSYCYPFAYDEGAVEPYEQYPHSVTIAVYSLNTNSWKKICQDKVFVDFLITHESVFVNGTAFWVGYNSDAHYRLVMFFDTKTNVLQKIRVPNWVVCHRSRLNSPLILPLGQSIAYFVEGDKDDWDDWDNEDDNFRSSHLDIWVLKDEMIDEHSWEKKMSVKLNENVLVEVLGIRNNGEPIQAKLNNLISYDLDTHKPYDFVESYDWLAHRCYTLKGYKSPFIIRPLCTKSGSGP